MESILRRQRSSFATILDFGCGDGYTGEHVQQVFGAPNLVGIDAYFPEASCGVVQGPAGTIERSREAQSLGTRRFDLVLLCDVIEHVEDDVGLLRMLRGEHMAPGALALVTVPAFQSLFSEHDRFLRHHRRYSLSALRRAVGQAGFSIITDGYLFGALLPARAAAKLVERGPAADPQDHGIGGWNGGPVLTRLLISALSVDSAILLAARRLGITLPGLTSWALCKAS